MPKLRKFIIIYCRCFIISLFLMIFTLKNVYAADVTIDCSIKYQTIDGWAITHFLDWDWEGPDGRYPIPEQDVMYQIKDDLGIDYVMNYELNDLFSKHEQTNDDSDPFNYNWSSYNAQLAGKEHVFERLQYQQNIGLKYGIASHSKPLWMGDANGNFDSTIPDIYDELAEYWAALLIYGRDNYGLTFPNDISLQIEPTFAHQQPNAMGFSPTELREAIKAVGSRLRQEGFNTMIIAPHEAYASHIINTCQTILPDPVAKSYISHLDYHGYDGNSAVNGPDAAIPGMTSVANDNLIKNSSLSLWMIEWVLFYDKRMRDYVDTLRLALDFAKMVYNHHVYGNTSLFVIWSSTYDWGYDKDGNGVMENEGIFGPGVTDGKLNLKKYGHVLSQYTKHIPPGSKRIDALLSGASNAFVTAYKDDKMKKFTIEFINKDTNSHTVNIQINNIQGLSTLDVIRTSATENSTNLGKVSVTNNSVSYTLSGESVTTFTGQFSTQENTPPEPPTGLRVVQ